VELGERESLFTGRLEVAGRSAAAIPRVLVVDHDAAARAALVELLTAHRYEVVEAADGREALTLTRLVRPDLVICDLVLPLLDGFDFAREVRSDPKLARTRVLIYTAHFHDERARETRASLGEALGISAIVQRPAEAEFLLTRVTEALASAPHARTAAPADLMRAHLRLVTDELSAKTAALQFGRTRLTALAELNVAIAAERDPESMLRTLCDGARELVNAGYVVLAVDPGDGEGVRCHSSGIAPTLWPLQTPSLEDGMPGRVVRECRAWRSRPLSGDPRECGLPAGYPPAFSAVIAPIVSVARSYGWLMLVNKTGAPEFSPQDRQSAEILGAHVGRAYENGMLYRRIERDAARLQAEIDERRRSEAHALRLNRVHRMLSGISHVIIGATRQRELFAEACSLAVHQGQFQAAWIVGRDIEADDRPVLAEAEVQPGLAAAARDAIATGGDIESRTCTHIFESRQTVVWDDLALGGPPPHVARRLAGLGLRSMIGLPLGVDSGCLGVLVIASNQARQFDEEERGLLETLAADIALGVDRLNKAQRLDYLSFYDPVTSLPNRAFLLMRLTQAVGQAKRDGRQCALVVCEPQRLKEMTVTGGRRAHENLLLQLGGRLALAVDDGSVVCRLPGDTFGVLLPDCGSADDVLAWLQGWWTSWLQGSFEFEDHPLRVSARAGIALYPHDGAQPEELLQSAEIALRQSATRDESFAFHRAEMSRRFAERQQLEQALARALAQQEFVLYYQPRVTVEGRRLVGLEALIRWQRPDHGLIPPTEFIPVLEETGLIVDVGLWVAREAAAQRRRWLLSGLQPPRVAVNVSTVQLRQPDFVPRFLQAVGAKDGACGIDIDVTESMLIDDAEAHIRKLHELREAGIGIAVDDFGRGYSSLSYLARLPVHTLKIDQTFVASMLENAQSMTLVTSIISLAHALRLDVIAESVEDEAQARTLRLLRCDEMQGFLFGHPVAPAELGGLLQ
jgi:diguanylate cyclase (GGDEF)-like protein